MGMGGMGMGGMGVQGPGAVTVKYGEKVYDAVFGDLIDYKVYFISVMADSIGVDYFDDGSHGDEVAYDGMPSLIMENDDTYLGPFSIKYKKQLEKALEHAEKLGALKFYNLQIVSEMETSKVTRLTDYQTRLGDVLEGLRARVAQFEGYDDTKYIKSIDPSLFEAAEGFGSMGGGGMAGGFLPDLPPAPGTQMQSQENMDGGFNEPGMPSEGGSAVRPIRGAQSAADALTGSQLGATELMNEF